MEAIKQQTERGEAGDYDRRQRLYDDTTTWLAEVLPGMMRSQFDYAFDGHELYGQDGSELLPIFALAITDAERTVAYRPGLAFEVRRRQLELEEYGQMLAMASGETPNTMVVVSDFPPELMDEHEDVGGYNVKRRQTMLRVISRNQTGGLRMVSQSLDGSERVALEDIYYSLGYQAAPGELLGQRVLVELSADAQAGLVDRLVNVYDSSLASRHGGRWKAGQLAGSEVNTYNFVCSQRVLLDAFMGVAGQNGTVSNSLLYGLAAEMDKRFRGRISSIRTEDLPISDGVSQSVVASMYEAGRIASASGLTFSGCGMSLGGSGATALSEMQAVGYGNRSTETTKYSFSKYMHCVACQPKPTKGERKQMCGPCGICRKCDTKIKIKGRL